VLKHAYRPTPPVLKDASVIKCALSRRSFVIGAVTAASVTSLLPQAARVQESIPAGAVEASFLLAKDGEKVKVRIGADTHEIRFIGMDAAEPAPSHNETECYAIESTNLLTNLLTDQLVYLESDVEDKDDKDRLWRYVWANVNGVPTLLNEYVLAQGAAITREEEQNVRYQDRLIQAEEAAQAQGRGLWGVCEGNGHLAIPRYGGKDQPGVFGETLVAERLAVTVSEPFVSWDYNYMTPKGGYKFLIFTVNMEYHGDGKKAYSAGRFEARDLDTDAKHKETPLLFEQPLDSGELSTHSYVWGHVGLEIQETATDLLVQYQLDDWGDVFMYWHLTI
jgi:micrococcal nuclease